MFWFHNIDLPEVIGHQLVAFRLQQLPHHDEYSLQKYQSHHPLMRSPILREAFQALIAALHSIERKIKALNIIMDLWLGFKSQHMKHFRMFLINNTTTVFFPFAESWCPPDTCSVNYEIRICKKLIICPLTKLWKDISSEVNVFNLYGNNKKAKCFAIKSYILLKLTSEIIFNWGTTYSIIINKMLYSIDEYCD